MSIDDKIKNEKMQCNINRKAAKISALSSRKIDEYLTGEEILPSDQSRIIEQTGFLYSPLGKAFEIQIKTIEDQGEKQIKALEKHEQQLVEYSHDKESLTHSNQTFEELANKRMEEIQNLSKQIDFNNLTCHYKSKSIPKNTYRSTKFL